MTHELIDVISRYSCLANQIHLPLQSGDNDVLIRMNRKHTVEKYLEIVEYIFKKIPQATLFTDIITGFSGETHEQFMNTARIMEKIKFHMAYIAKYSPRPGAASSRWPDDVSPDEKKKRFHYLTQILQKYARERNSQLIGKTVRVLVREKDRKDGYLSGHTEGKIIVRFPSDDVSLIGKFIDIKITSAEAFSAEGKFEKVYA